MTVKGSIGQYRDGRTAMYRHLKSVKPTCCGNCGSKDNSDLTWFATMDWFLCGNCRKAYDAAKKLVAYQRFDQLYAVKDIFRQTRRHENT